MGWRRWCVGAAAAVIAVLLPATPALAQDHLSDLSVRVDHGGSTVVVGRLTTYTIRIANPGDEPVTATVRASVPPWFTEVTAVDAEVTAGHAAWWVTVPPGDDVAVHLSGVYESGVPLGDTDRVTLTACVMDDDGAPAVCATDVATLSRGGWLQHWWWALLGGALAVVGLVAWHRRRATPAPPTPTAPTPAVSTPSTGGVASAGDRVPVETVAAPAGPAPTTDAAPDPGDPALAAPVPAEPVPVDPVPADAVPVDQAPADPVPAEPVSTHPVPAGGPAPRRRSRVKPMGRSRSRRRRAAPAR